MTERRDFDTAAATWDKPQRVRLATEVAAAMATALPLSREWDAMDFGCGTGLVTLSLTPWWEASWGWTARRTWWNS